MVTRFMTLMVWLLLGGSVAYWGLQLFARPLAMPASVLPAGETRSAQVDLSRLLGVTPPEAAAEPEAPVSTRLRLLGVVAPRNPRDAQAGEGVALIEVDGVPRTVRVGAAVDGELRLLRVDARSASLGLLGQAPSQVLQISPPAAPATGMLQPAVPSPVVLGGNPNAGAAGVPLRAGPSVAPPMPGPQSQNPVNGTGAVPVQPPPPGRQAESADR